MEWTYKSEEVQVMNNLASFDNLTGLVAAESLSILRRKDGVNT